MEIRNDRDWKQDLPAFREKTAGFYAGELSKDAYKGFSGLYGSYAQKGGKASMLRLRMTGGCVSKEKLKFIADTIRKYEVKKAHFTTCQTIQLHDLDGSIVADIMEQAMMQESSPWAAAETFRAMLPAVRFPGWRRTNTLMCFHGQRQQANT